MENEKCVTGVGKKPHLNIVTNIVTTKKTYNINNMVNVCLFLSNIYYYGILDLHKVLWKTF